LENNTSNYATAKTTANSKKINGHYASFTRLAQSASNGTCALLSNQQSIIHSRTANVVTAK